MKKTIYKDKPNTDIAESLNGLGTIFCHQGKYKQAQHYFKQALAMLKTIHGEKPHPDIADSLNGLGTLFSHQGKYEQAQPYFEQALVMRKTIYREKPHPDKSHPDIEIVRKNLEQVIYKQQSWPSWAYSWFFDSGQSTTEPSTQPQENTDTKKPTP